MKRRRDGVELKSRTPNEADEWCEAGYAEAARELAKYLKEALNVQRPIRSLKLDEMRNIVQTVVHFWIVRESKRPVERPYDATKDRPFSLI